jgi:hypothetical protein
MLSSPVYAEPHPRPDSLLGTIPSASETPLFLVTPLLPNNSALFSAMAPTHHQSFQSLTHSFHPDGGAPLFSRAPSGSECTPLPPISPITLRTIEGSTKLAVPLSFQPLTNCPFFIPFVLTFIHVMGGTPLPLFKPLLPSLFSLFALHGRCSTKNQKTYNLERTTKH